MKPVSQGDLARAFTIHFDRLQGVDLALSVLLHHLHDRGLIEPDLLADIFRAVADAAALEQSSDQALPCRKAADTCDLLAAGRPVEESERPDWLNALLRGARDG